MPAIDARLVGGGRWALAGEKPGKLSLLVFYRGLFCPFCKAWLAELNALAPEFERCGVTVIALSCDKKDAAEKAAAEWGLDNLRVGYKLDPEDARRAGLYISEGRGTSVATGVKEPMLFSEPGVLAVMPEGTLYAAWIQSAPQARPAFAAILKALEGFVERRLPDPRGSA